MRKIYSSILLIFLMLNYFFVFSVNNLEDKYLYYLDKDFNGKIDTLEIEFNNELNGTLNKDKIFFYSNAGGLSFTKIDSLSGTNLVKDYYLSGNILGINLFEQDNYLTGLTIDNTTLSHLRIKTNSGVGIKDIFGNEIKFLYTTSFNSYKNVSFKSYGNGNNSNSGSLVEETNSGNIIEEENIVNSGGLFQEIDDIITNTGATDINSGTGNYKVNTGTGSQGLDDNIITIIDETLETIQLGEGNISNSNNSNSGNLNENLIVSTGSINSFSGIVSFLFQSPTYLLDTDIIKDKYECDTTKTECKVNYNLELDSKTISTTKYNCEWNFGFSSGTLEEQKCNPNTIIYPVGEFKTTFKIKEKDYPNNFYEKEITIKNEGYKEAVKETKIIYVGSNSSSTSLTPISIMEPEIIVQGGLSDDNTCKSQSCSINLQYNQKNSQELCLWSFPYGSFVTGTEKKCNPGYIKYGHGDFKVTLRVYQDGNIGNYKETYLYFSNKIKEDESSSGTILDNISENVKSVIKLQGSLNSYKTLSGNILSCTKDCSVNLDGSESIGKDLKYNWDFGNGETSSVKNPKSISYSPGNYKVSLKVYNDDFEDLSYFYVNVADSNQIFDTGSIDYSIFTLKIPQVLPNPFGNDDAEFIEIMNYSDKNVSLDNCYLDDIIGSGSKPYSLSGIILEAGKSKKFYKFDTKINLNNSGKEEANLICYGKVIDNVTFDYTYPEGFLIKKEYENTKEVKKGKNPGEFEIIFNDNSKKTINQNDNLDLFNELLLENLPQEEKLKKINDLANNSFTQKISKQKSGIKIYGKGIPNSEIVIKLEENFSDEFSLLEIFYKKTYADDNVFYTKIDNSGKYELFIKNPNIGVFQVKNFIKLAENNLIEIQKNSTFEVDNDYIEYISASSKSKSNSSSKTATKPKSVITVQGKLSSSKKLEGNKITCYDMDECGINFDGRGSQGDKLTYFWKYGNLTTFDKSNPSPYKFPAGKHIITLLVKSGDLEDSSSFIVEVIPKFKETDTDDKSSKSFIPKATASFENSDNGNSFNKSFYYIIFTFFVFLGTSFIILKKKGVF